jgi:hypothetical protein
LTFKIGGLKSWFLKYGDQKFKKIKIGGPKMHLRQDYIIDESI